MREDTKVPKEEVRTDITEAMYKIQDIVEPLSDVLGLLVILDERSGIFSSMGNVDEESLAPFLMHYLQAKLGESAVKVVKIDLHENLLKGEGHASC